MTEAEWLVCANIYAMLSVLAESQSGDRKFRLFSCACWRRVQPFLPDERQRNGLDACERVADGAGSPEDRELVRELTGEPRLVGTIFHNRRSRSAVQAGWLMASSKHTRVLDTNRTNHKWDGAVRAEAAAQAGLLRHIFGNPFRPVTFDPAWRTADVMLLAEGAYAERAFDRLPILADALQDAGCDAEPLLAHLRDATAPHVRGCWALDLVLGRE